MAPGCAAPAAAPPLRPRRCYHLLARPCPVPEALLRSKPAFARHRESDAQHHLSTQQARRAFPSPTPLSSPLYAHASLRSAVALSLRRPPRSAFAAPTSPHRFCCTRLPAVLSLHRPRCSQLAVAFSLHRPPRTAFAAPASPQRFRCTVLGAANSPWCFRCAVLAAALSLNPRRRSRLTTANSLQPIRCSAFVAPSSLHPPPHTAFVAPASPQRFRCTVLGAANSL
ncbi:hypothetical protein C8R45DRAFT_379434 [Mycena sanguinolenta]|nr:hypothetical protein C8R45DRAFT_379434 [Mycena sanguinolenta]